MLVKDETAVPSVLRSERHLMESGVGLEPSDAHRQLALPISPEGVTFEMAQSAAWVDYDHFAVGRWDGSLTVFRFSESAQAGPLITIAASCPSAEGIQMITWVADRLIATSNDDRTLALWRPNENWDRLLLTKRLEYDPALGAANSGDVTIVDGQLWLAVGHANGFLSLWRGKPDGSGLEFADAADLRNERPTNPWDLHNVRGVVAIEDDVCRGAFISGSENGDLCVVTVPSARVVTRRSYNAGAQRGINAIALDGRRLLVANCSVGPDDRNLWCFTLDERSLSLELTDAVNLKIDAGLAQAFNFAVVWAEDREGRCFFASTQEGALWMGRVSDKQELQVLGYQKVTAPLGAALAYASNGNLAFVAYDLYEFNTLPRSSSTVGNPHRLDSGRA